LFNLLNFDVHTLTDDGRDTTDRGDDVNKPPMFDLDGKVALITGGGGGLGAAAAKALVAHGARVALLDNNEASACDAAALLGPNALPYQGDISDVRQVQRCVAKIRSDLGPITVLHNNAAVHKGYGGGDQAAHELSSKVWRELMTVNLDGTLNVTQSVIPHMLEARCGSIINMSSLGGGVLGSLNTAYAATKGGIVGFTRALVVGYSGTGIRANVICPGFISTQMTLPAERNAEDFARYASKIPSGRGGVPDDLGGLIVLLASDASSYINGALITIDGGVSLV
jgi:NAD(P)-dependent dehydrogenase (short-subunit alcohol dehydrogenase family)